MVSFEPDRLRFNCFLLEPDRQDPELALRKPYRKGGKLELAEKKLAAGAPAGSRAFMSVAEGSRPRWMRSMAGIVEDLDDFVPSAVRFVLFLPVQGRVFAVCFGYGASTLEWSAVEANFGLRVAARVVNPEAVQSISSRQVSANAKSRSSTLPLGGPLRELEVDYEGQLVRKLVGRFDGVNSPAGRSFSVSGSDSISFDSEVSLPELVARLSEMLDLLSTRGTAEAFAFVDAITPIPASSELSKVLTSELVSAMKGEPPSKLLGTQAAVHFMEVVPPDDLSFDAVESVQFSIGERTAEFRFDGIPALGDITVSLKARPSANFLKSTRVVAIGADGAPVGRSMPLLSWIVFEFGDAVRRYILSFGRWFRLDEDFSRKLQAELLRIRDVSSELSLPSMNPSEREDEYNRRVSHSRPDVLLLDKADVRTQENSEVEPCDLLFKSGHLSHVKKWTGSSTASHHLNQGTVSAELLVSDSKYRANFQRKVKELNPDFEHVAASAPRVVTWVFAVNPDYSIPTGLPTFAKVALKDASRRVRRLQAEPTLAVVSRSK